jgi:hypothetical protein
MRDEWFAGERDKMECKIGGQLVQAAWRELILGLGEQMNWIDVPKMITFGF